MARTQRRTVGSLTLAAALSVVTISCSGCSNKDASSQPPNILFIVMDDIGIDQMATFGYGGDTPPATPHIESLANAGIRFHNAWSMPACTTSRGVFFDGRYPLRTNVYGALGPDDLANSQVSPYEVTVPKLLAKRGYQSAMFGKFHIGLQANNPAGYAMPLNLGWNYFSGWLDDTGDPSSIDITAGGVAQPPVEYSCGFVPSKAAGGADFGACSMPDGSCTAMSVTAGIPPGRICRDQGGILDPEEGCQSPPPHTLDFSILSGHYVSPLVINHEDGSVEQVPPTDLRARRFRGTVASDAAIAWINARPSNQPWMASVTYASAHTPVMQPPVEELPRGTGGSDLDCANSLAQRALTNMMVESLDYDVGRLLVETGLAQRDSTGQLVYDPSASNTMIILVDDNGTLGLAVKEPFDPSRAKGTAYQTGVWVPLIVAGPLVKSPGRTVTHMVNIADLFALFGEIAGLDVHAEVPRPIDSFPMLPYLLNPDQPSIRTTNFTQVGPNLQANGAMNGPCGIAATCTQIPVTKSVCEDNQGIWYGAGSEVSGVPPEGFARCCDVQAFLIENNMTPFETILPDYASAIRNDEYKLVENTTMAYNSQEQPCKQEIALEFYRINQDVPDPLLDKADKQLPLESLTPEQRAIYDDLLAQMQALLASSPPCPGDGNIDFVVDQLDLEEWRFYRDSSGLSSWYDLNLDGLTNDADETIILQNLGNTCPKR